MSALNFTLLGHPILLIKLNTYFKLLFIINILNILIAKCKRRR